MLYRAGSLITNLLMGYALFGTTYSKQKILGVVIVSVGIYMSTTASLPASSTVSTCTLCDIWSSLYNNDGIESQFLLGIVILTVTVLMASGLSCYQDQVFKKYGKEPLEALFWTHTLSLPLFSVASSTILNNIVTFNDSVMMYGLPKMWWLLIFNVLTQYACIRGVYILLSHGSALTCNLTITLRKFCSLIVSVLLFKNEFSVRELITDQSCLVVPLDGYCAGVWWHCNVYF